jgi:hypothetical protein
LCLQLPSSTMSSAYSLDRTTPPPSQELPPDNPSSLQAPQGGTSTTKERRNPSVTPRKFRRFFTPRPQNSTGTPSSQNPLHETSGVGNRRSIHRSTPIRTPRPLFGQENTRRASTRDSKRRKLYHTPNSSPETSQELGKQPESGLEEIQGVDSNDELDNIPSSPCERAHRDLSGIPEEIVQQPSEKIVQVDQRGLSGQLLQMRINAAPTARSQYLSCPINGMFLETCTLSNWTNVSLRLA